MLSSELVCHIDLLAPQPSLSYLFHISSCAPNFIQVLWCEVCTVLPFNGVEPNGETLEELYVFQWIKYSTI